MKQQLFNTDPQLEATFKQYNPDFIPGFEDRLMNKISGLGPHSYNKVFDRAFQRITLTGVAAVAVLLISIFIADGSLSTDTLIGTGNMDLETLTAMTVSGF